MLPFGRRAGLRLFTPVVCIALVGAGVPTVLAATGGSGSLGQAPAMAPGNPDFDAGLKRDRERLKQQGTQKAKAERKASRQRMRGASRAEALEAGRDSFPEEFKAPVFDGDEPAPGLEVVDQKGSGTALVEDPKGTKVLLTSSTGLQAKTPSGGFAPVDLSLRESTGMFATGNSNSDLEIAKDAEDGIEFADAGFSIATQAAAPATQGVESDDRVLFQGTSQDTAFLVVPRPMGAELGWLIQSPEAPERFVLNVEVPAGGQLRRATTDNPIPGDPPRAIEIADKDGKGVGYVYPPLVYDTDGTPVESDFEIEDGDRIAVTVKHQGKDLRFPLFADPEVIIPDAGGISGFPGWQNTQVPAVAAMGNNFYGVAKNDCAFYCNGLYLSMPTNTSYDRTGTGARFFYQAPPNTYVYRGILQNMAHSPLVVFGFTFSRWFNGLLGGPTIWEQNVNYQNQAGGLGPNPFGPASNAASGVTHDFCQLPRCTRTGGTEQSALAIGIAAQNDVNTARINTGNLKATVTVNNTSVYLGDRRPPAMSSARPADRNWFDDSAAPVRTVGTVSAGDLGLGMYGIRLAGGASGNGTLRPPACTGDPNRSPCPANYATAGFSYRLNEGINTLTLTPEDIVDNQGALQSWTEKVDRGDPTAAITGGNLQSRADNGVNSATNPAYKAAVAGTDTWSGVRRLELLVDGSPVDSAMTGTQALTQGDTGAVGSGLTGTLDFDTASLTEGRRTIQVRASDGVAPTPHTKSSSDTFRVIVDKTKPPAPTATGTLRAQAVGAGVQTLRVVADDARPTNINAVSGVQKIELLATGTDGAERSLGTKTQSAVGQPLTADFTIDTTQDAFEAGSGLEEGRYVVKAVATDGANNVGTAETFEVIVDRTSPDVTLSGALGDSLGGALTISTASLNYDADDGPPSSGLASLSLSIDDTEVVSATTPATAASGSHNADLSGLSAGAHTVTVDASDAVGNKLLETYIFKVVKRPTGESRTVDIGGQGSLTIIGAAPGDRAGASAAPIGDINRDGIPDFAVGAPQADPTVLKPDAGIVYVIFGRRQGGTVNLNQFTPADGYRILGANLSDNAGSALAAAGDLNGDGTNDLLVGAPRTGLLGLGQRGAVWAIFMPDSEAMPADIDLASPGGNRFRVDGPTRPLGMPGVTLNYQRPFGSVLSAIVHRKSDNTDINGDGFDDFVVGSPEETTTGPADSGQAFVIYGKANSAAVATDALSTGAGITIGGGQSGDALGSGVTITEGDRLNGEPQLIVSAPGVDAGGKTDSGRVYQLRTGALASGSINVSSLDSGSGSIDGPGPGARLGSTVTPLGHVNQDEIADYALGGTTVAVVYGDKVPGNRPVADTPGYRITSTTAQYGGEKTVSPQADVDGDNINDLLVGQASPTSASSWVLYGRTNGGDLDLANLPASSGSRLNDADAATGTISDVGDVVRDGNGDYAVGSPNWNNGLLGAQTGRVRVGSSLDQDSCLDDVPSAGEQTRTYMCDSLGVQWVDEVLTKPASLARAQARSSAAGQSGPVARAARVKFGRTSAARHVWRNDAIAFYSVIATAVRYDGEAEYDQFLRLNDGDLSEPNPSRPFTQWTQSIRRLSGDDIKARLSFACRVDVTGDDDRPCSPVQEGRDQCSSSEFSRQWWRQPEATGGEPRCGYTVRVLNDVRRGYAFTQGLPNTRDRYFYRANLFFQPEKPGHRNPNELSGGYFAIPATMGPRGTKEIQTYRFRCGRSSTVAGRVRCIFDTKKQTLQP